MCRVNLVFSSHYGVCPVCGSLTVNTEDPIWKRKVDGWHRKRERRQRREAEDAIIQHEAMRNRLPFGNDRNGHVELEG